jgi:DNA-binding beta-propeller fold protein YncE
VIVNLPNPQATSTTNDQVLSSGILVGREPHEPTFTPNGKELWVTLRGENRIAVLDLEKAKRESSGIEGGSIRMYVPTVLGPAQVWFSKDGAVAFVISQKTSAVEVFRTNFDDEGFSHPTSVRTLDISGQDPYAFTPFLKLTPDGKEIWFSHKLADALSSRAVEGNQALLDNIPLGKNARPNHIEFVENRNGKVVYATLARVDDGGPDSVASSRVLIIDRSGAVGTRAVVGNFFSHGREAHGIWTNPANDRLYIAHEQDQLPGTPNEGQTVCSVFDVTEPLSPKFITQIPLGEMNLPSGKLRNKKSINLVYVRPGKTL